MRIPRMITGCSILLGSSWVSWMISKAVGIDTVGTVAISTIVGFVAGIIFMSGGRK